MEARLVVVLAFVAVATAGPISKQDSDKCAVTCSPSQTRKFQYESGITYTYDYKVDTETLMSGASDNKAKLTVQTSADINVVSYCEFSLRLRNTRLFNSDARGRMQIADNEAEFRNAVEKTELRFSFQDGLIETVCPSLSEKTWVLNFKKGILSSFQNSMDDLTQAKNVTERDVAGVCNTEYQVSSGYYSTTIKKIKNVLSCTGRNGFNTIFQMMPYTVPSELQSIPIMKTTHECDQEIKSGQMTSSTCTETHVYRPFSNGNSGGVTRVVQSLAYNTYKYESKSPEAVTSRDTLVFDFSVEKNSKIARSEVEKYLNNICESSSKDIRPDSPSQFAELVNAMKSLSQKDMRDLHILLKTKSLCPTNDRTYKWFMDALPFTHTEASMDLMTTAIINNDINIIQSQMWINSLGFIQNPTSDMLMRAKALVDNEQTRMNSSLAVSAMVNNYCQTKATCHLDRNVIAIMASFEKVIGYRCDAVGENFDKILTSLRAIGNAGLATRSVAFINKCLTSNSNALEIRISAAAAFRRMSCDINDDILWSTYQNGKLDSELRVAAYLAIMRCPSEAIMRKMATSLEDEEDQNVGAFVYSHLKNLKMTSDPHKQGIAQVAKNLHLNDKFELSSFRNSHNFEASVLINKLNMGFTAESNLVWSSTNGAPRSLSGNLTVGLFGQAINMMDFGFRAEGLEKLLSKGKGVDSQKYFYASVYGRIFGNEMFFTHSDKTWTLPFKNSPLNWLQFVNAMSKKHDYSLSQSDQFMDLSLTVPTIAGMPITLQLNGTGTYNLLLNGKADLKKLNQASPSMNIEGEIRPSAAIEITGTMSIDAMVTKTGLRMRNTMHTSTALKGSIMLQRGQVFKMELDTPEEKMEIFNADSKFFLIHNKVEQEQPLIEENRRKYQVCSGENLATVVGFELCGEIAFPNASLLNDAPYFPMTGPSSLSINLYKRDSHNKYKFMATRTENKQKSVAQISFNTPGSKVDRVILMETELNYPKKTLEAIMRTPWKKATLNGALIDSNKMKSLTGNVRIDDSDEYAFTSEVKISKTKTGTQFSPMIEVRRPRADNIQLLGSVSIINPFKEANIDIQVSGLSKKPIAFKSFMENTKKNKGINATFSMDGRNEYTFKSKNQYSVMGKKSITASMTNNLEIKSPSRTLVSLSNSLDYKEDRSIILDTTLSIYRLLMKPANVKVSLTKNAKGKNALYKINSNLKSSAINARLISTNNIKASGTYSTKSSIEYTIPKVTKNKILWNAKFNDKSNKAVKRYFFMSDVQVPKNKDYNMNLKVKCNLKKKHSDAEVDLKYGANYKDKTKTLFFSTSLTRKIATMKNANLVFKMNAKAPSQKVDVSLIGTHQHSPKLLNSGIKLNYGNGKDLSADLILRDKSSKLEKYNGKATVKGLGSTYTLTSSLDQKSSKQYIHQIVLNGPKGLKHTINTEYKNAKSHQLNTKIISTLFKTIGLSCSINPDIRNLQISGMLNRGKSQYGFKSTTKVTKVPSGKVEMEVYYPKRRVTLLVDGGLMKGKYKGKIETAWDANNDKSQRMIIDGSAFMKKARKAMSLGGDLSFKSPFKGFEDLKTDFKYANDENQHDFRGEMSFGGKGNDIVSTMKLNRPISFKNFVMSADLKSPFKQIKALSFNVNHMNHMENSGKIISKAKFKHNAQIYSYAMDIYNAQRTLNGFIHMQTPWKVIKDVNVTIDHRHGENMLNSQSTIKQNGKLTGLHSIIFNGRESTIDVEFSLNPSVKHISEISGKMTSKFIRYPMTADAKLQWSPKSMATLVGSVSIPTITDAFANLKMTTPFRGYKNIVFKASNQKEGQETVSNMNLDLGVRKEYNIESRINVNDMKSFRLKVRTPLENFRSMDTGMQASWGADHFDSKADFKIVPIVDKYQGTLNWKFDGNLDGNFRVDTPLKDYAYFEITTSSVAKRNVRTSFVEVEYYPSKLYRITNKYSLDPLFIETKINSPFKRYNNLGFVVQHQHTESSVMCHGEVTYHPQKKIEGDVNVDWSSDVDGSLVIKTPFRGYRSNKVIVKHKGDMEAFTTHAEANIATKIVSADVNFDMSGDKTEGSLVFNSPVEGHENVELSFNKQGNLNKLICSALLSVNGQRYQANLEHSLKNTAMRSFLNINTPLTKNLKAVITHKGGIESFINKVSFNYGQQYDVDTTVSFDFKHPDISGNALLKAKLDGPERTARATFSKNGRLDDMQFSGSVSYNKNDVSLDGSWKLTDGIESHINLKTPFENFKHLVLSVSHTGDLYNFQTESVLTYMDNKSITGKMTLDTNGIESITFSTDLILPFESMRSTHANLKHSYKFYNDRIDLSGDATLYTTIGRFGQSSINYNINGDLKKLNAEITGKYGSKEASIMVNAQENTYDGLKIDLKLKTPFESIRKADLEYSHNGNMYDFSINSNLNLNNDELFNCKISNSFGNAYLKTNISLQTPVTPVLDFFVNANYVSITSCSTEVAIRYGNHAVDFNLSQREEVFDTKGMVNYNAGEYLANIRVNKAGQLNDMSFNANAEINSQQYIVVGHFQSKGNYKGSLSVGTPIEGYKNIGMSFEISGKPDDFKVSSEVTIKDGKRYSINLGYYKYLLRRIETNLEIRTPISGYEFNKFEYRHTADGEKLECYSMIKYGNNQKIIYEMNLAKSPRPSFRLSLKTPLPDYKELTASGSVVNNLPYSSSVTGSFNSGNEVVMAVTGKLDMSRDYIGSLELSTPMDDFRNVGFSFNHEGNLENFNTQGKIKYMDRKEISGELTVKNSAKSINAVLRTPFAGYRLTQLTHNHKMNEREISSESKFIYGNNQVLEADIKVFTSPNYEMKTTVRSPFEGYEYMSLSYLIDVTHPQYKVNGNVNLGRRNNVVFNSLLDMSYNNDISGFANLRTPINGYRNLKMDFKHKGNDKKFETTGSVNYADGKEIKGEVTFSNNRWRAISGSAELSTPFVGMESTKAEIGFRRRSNLIVSSASLEFDGQKLDSSLKVIFSPRYDFQFRINTPYKSLKMLRATLNANLNAPNYAISSSLDYNKDLYKATGKLNLFSLSKLDGSLMVETPIDGFKFTKVEHNHKFDSRSMNGKTEIAYENGQKTISVDLESTMSPSMSAKLDIKTPFNGYRSIEGSASFEKSYMKYEVSSFMKFGARKLYSVKSGIDYAVEPYRAFAKISTPITNFRNTDLVLTHEGNMYKFKSTGSFFNDLTNNVTVDASFHFMTFTDMSLRTSMKSSLENMDDLNFVLQTSDKSGDHKLNVIGRWTAGKQIQTNVAYQTREGWNENSINGQLSLSTPFECAKSLSVMVETTHKRAGDEAKLVIDHNGKNLVDVSGQFNSDDKHNAKLTFRHPQAMEFTAAGSKQDVDFYANWNSNNRDSNVRLFGNMNNKDITMSVEQNARKVGVSYSMEKTSDKLMSSGKFFWDAGAENQVSYDLIVTDSSRRNTETSDASLKLGLPFTTLKFDGSLSKSSRTKKADVTFKWDADNDDKKSVTIKYNLNQGRRAVGDITLIMPAINKKIRMDGELLQDNGRTILDSKTEFSYSTDSRKTVTIFSKLEDISSYRNTNYSLEMGVSHPFTNIDIQMKSNIGKSDEKMTVGVEGSYLTAQRDTKNLALLAEINKIKKQISLQILEPTNFEVIGSVISTTPTKMSLVSKRNNVNICNTFFTYDEANKYAELNSQINSESITMTAEYPSSRDFHAYITHSNSEYRNKEALLAVHLNNSRVIHSRLAWRPELVADISESLNKKMASVSVDILQNWGVINQEIAREVTGKYKAVAGEVERELRPVIIALEKEFEQITQYMYQMKMSESFINGYRNRYAKFVSLLSSSLGGLSDYPITDRYYKFVGDNVKSLLIKTFGIMSALSDLTERVELALEKYHQDSKKMAASIADTIFNGTYIEYAKSKLEEIRNINVSPYIHSMQVLNKGKNVIDNLKEYGVHGLRAVWERSELKPLRENVNIIYQQGAWAYKYWEVEKNLLEKIENSVKLIIEIVKDELREMAAKHNELSNPITYYNPEQGEIQAQFTVPFEMKSLYEKPDFSALVADIDHTIEQIEGYMNTIKNTSAKMMKVFSSEETTEEMIKNYKPKRTYKPKYGSRKNKRQGRQWS